MKALTPTQRGTRGKLDDTLAAMFSNPDYREDYLFYAHMISLCSIRIRHDLPAPAGVAFNIDHYNLYINPSSQWVPIENIPANIMAEIDKDDLKIENGVQMYRASRGFDDFALKERLAILKHEMLHILYDHVIGRGKDLNPYTWNFATDCALNQHVNADHLPESCITPKTLGKMFKVTIPLDKSSEFYYELIKEEAKKQQDKQKQDGKGQPQDDDGQGSQGQGQPGSGDPRLMDSHDTWNESTGDPELQHDVTKKMIERSQNETIKSRGTVPSECSEWLEMFTRKAELNWKKVLRGIVGNKRIGTRSTIMRRDRRFPERDDLRGKTKERRFNLLVIADVSGSMSSEEVIETLGEVRHICDITKTAVDLIQIDTQAYTPEKLTKSTKTITRKGHGGTTLHPAIEKAKEHKIDYQAVVVVTDGGLWDGDIDHFRDLGKKVIWLVSSRGTLMDAMNSGRMQGFKLQGGKE